MNPILPLSEFIPDAEAHRFSDGRLYIYGSRDVRGNSGYCSKSYKVFSTDNMIDWRDHGISFSSQNEEIDSCFRDNVLYAPDCIEKDGKYYLYFCTANNGEGVSISDKPFEFTNGVPVKGANSDAIDPAIFIDDDGEAYLYWGQFHARGARLKPNMREIDESTLNTHLLTEEEHGFHEGSSVRKRNGIYYFVYTDISRGKASCLSYATSKSPLGPFKKGGVIIDNTGSDPDNWNNHGSIAEYNGQWYVFYHRASHNSNYSRRTCVEPIYFNEDGSINEVEMTTQGAEPSINPLNELEASRACFLNGDAYVEYDDTSEYLKAMFTGDYALYKYFDFDKEVTEFHAVASSLEYNGTIEIRLDNPDGDIVGVCKIKPTSGWTKWKTFKCNVKKIHGKHTLCLVFRSDMGRPCNLKNFKFF